VDGEYGDETIAAGRQFFCHGGFVMANTPFEVMKQLSGTTENSDPNKSNPAIAEIFRDMGYSEWDDGALPWCGVAMAWCMKECNLPFPKEFAMARSWLNFGEPVRKPVEGDVTVLWRGSPSAYTGHVAFYVSGHGTGTLRLLGGNQSNQVNISQFPESRVLGHRRTS
jgi:uncharacterized protein (TIGR02594 family)